MIAACPRCSTRFRIGAERLRDEGVRLRCTQCQAVFRVYPPQVDAPRRRDDPTVEAELTPPPRPPERERMVLVADPDAERGKASATHLARLGLHPLLVHDGVEALLTLQRTLPSRLLVDASLPRLCGAELCEVVKRNESLRATRVVLAGAPESISSLGALRAAGLGPDAVLEYGDLPDGLEAALRIQRPLREGAQASPLRDEPHGWPLREEAHASLPREEAHASLPREEAPVSPVPGDGRDPSAAPVFVDPGVSGSAVPSDPTPAGVVPTPDPELARAERLARIVVSDIVLYNADRFERAARGGDVLEALGAELDEARTLFRQRVSRALCDARDFVGEEILRVARQRASR